MNKLISDLIGKEKTQFNNKELLNNCSAIIKLSEFVHSKEPDLILIPLTGALPLRIFLTFIFNENKWKLPQFRFIHLTSTSGPNINLKALRNTYLSNLKKNILKKKYIINYNIKGKYKNVFLLDEVITGSCWTLFFSPLANNLFKDFVKNLGINELNLVGITTNKLNLNIKRDFLFKNFIHSFFKLYYNFNYKIINILIDLYSESEYKENSMLSPFFNNKLNELINKNNQGYNVDEIIKELIIELLYSDKTFIDVFKKKEGIRDNNIEENIELIKKALIELQENIPYDRKKSKNFFNLFNEKSKKKEILKRINELIELLKDQKPKWFEKNALNYKLNIKLFEIDENVIFSDEENLIGIKRKYIAHFKKKNIYGTEIINNLAINNIKENIDYNNIKVRYEETKNQIISKEFYFLMKFFINLLLLKNNQNLKLNKYFLDNINNFKDTDIDFYNRMIFLINNHINISKKIKENEKEIN